MGRHSKLTEAQWEQVRHRLLAGETARALGKEFGISEAGIRKKFGANQKISAQSAQVRTVAEKLAEANTALEGLPLAQRDVAIGLAEKLKSISQSMALGAELSAKSYHRLSSLSNAELQKVDDTDIAKSEASLKIVAGLQRMANEAAASPLNLLAANKEAVRKGDSDEPGAPSGVLVVPGVLTDSTAWTALVNK